MRLDKCWEQMVRTEISVVTRKTAPDLSAATLHVRAHTAGRRWMLVGQIEYPTFTPDAALVELVVARFKSELYSYLRRRSLI